MRRSKKKNNPNDKIVNYIEMRFKVGGTYPSIYDELVTMGYPESEAVKMLKYQEGGAVKTNKKELDLFSPEGIDFSTEDYQNSSSKYRKEIKDMEIKRLENLDSKKKEQVQKTVSEIWTEITGLKWEEAKRRGLTDGTKKSNLELIKRLETEGNKVLSPNSFQEGGEVEGNPEQGDPEQMMQQLFEYIIQSLQEGREPSDIMQELVSQGMSEQQAEQILQQAIQILQGGIEGDGGAEQVMQEGGEIDQQAIIQEIFGGIQEALADNQSEEDIAEYISQEYGLPVEQAIGMIEQVKQG